jgi:integrase
VLTTTGRTPVSGFSKLKISLDKIIARDGGGDMLPWRLHDLRRSAATGMVEIGVAPHVVELCLNHVSGARAGIAGVHNRAQMLPERREALEKWGEHVRRLVSPPADNVVQLNRYAASSG